MTGWRWAEVNLATVMQALADRLDTIPGLRVYGYPPDKPPAPPSAVVTYPDTYTYDETYARGMDRLELPVVLLVGKVSDRASRDTIAAYADGAGGQSAFDAVSGLVLAETEAAVFDDVGLRASLSTSTESYVAWTVTGSTHYLRAYIRTPAVNTINSRLMWNGSAGSTTFGWDIRETVSIDRIAFAVRNVNQFSLGIDGVNEPLTPNTVYRIEAKIVTGPAGTAEVRLYDDAGTLLDSDTFAGAIDAATEIRYGIGNGAAATQVWDLDAIGYSPTSWLGPWVAKLPGDLANSFEGIADGVAITTDNSGTGKSVKQVLESGTYTAFDTCRVTGVLFDIVTIGAVQYLSATFTIDITGSGA